MLLYFRCMSVAYSPIGRECRISRFDQRDSRILYDPDFDYYENLVGKRHITVLHSMKHSTRSILLTVHPRPPARVHQGGHHISAFPPIHQKWGAHGSSRPHCTRKGWERENLFGRVCSTAQIFSSSKTVRESSSKRTRRGVLAPTSPTTSILPAPSDIRSSLQPSGE